MFLLIKFIFQFYGQLSYRHSLSEVLSFGSEEEIIPKLWAAIAPPMSKFKKQMKYWVFWTFWEKKKKSRIRKPNGSTSALIDTATHRSTVPGVLSIRQENKTMSWHQLVPTMHTQLSLFTKLSYFLAVWSQRVLITWSNPCSSSPVAHRLYGRAEGSDCGLPGGWSGGGADGLHVQRFCWSLLREDPKGDQAECVGPQHTAGYDSEPNIMVVTGHKGAVLCKTDFFF